MTMEEETGSGGMMTMGEATDGDMARIINDDVLMS